MSLYVSYIPDDDELPRARYTPEKGLCSMRLDRTEDVAILFHTPAKAAAYCRELAKQATWLADQIEETSRVEQTINDEFDRLKADLRAAWDRAAVEADHMRIDIEARLGVPSGDLAVLDYPEYRQAADRRDRLHGAVRALRDAP